MIWLTKDNENYTWVDDDEYEKNRKKYDKQGYIVGNGAKIKVTSQTGLSNSIIGTWVRLDDTRSVTPVPAPYIPASSPEYSEEDISTSLVFVPGMVRDSGGLGTLRPTVLPVCRFPSFRRFDNPMNNTRFKEILDKFNSVRWHDSKLLEFRMNRSPERERFFNVELHINAITNEGYTFRKLIFEETRILVFDLDLLGIALCSGDIGGGRCYADAIDIEEKYRDKRRDFDLPDDSLPFDELFACSIEMIHPGGEILIFARNLRMEI